MLEALQAICNQCSLCPLGAQTVPGASRPQVFSNMIQSDYVVVGQNPGKTECKVQLPFMGSAGKNFDKELAKHGLTRDLFYITNVLHCYTPGNRAPTAKELAACRSLFRMELQYLKPKLVITLGKFAFQAVCGKSGSPDHYRDALGRVTNSQILSDIGESLNVFPIYHPSGMNLANQDRRAKFEEDIATLAWMITA